eukprot:COSAG02_NODE_155_length_33066_cov_32.167562_5_plen_79_part_00
MVRFSGTQTAQNSEKRIDLDGMLFWWVLVGQAPTHAEKTHSRFPPKFGQHLDGQSAGSIIRHGNPLSIAYLYRIIQSC